jgi:hypothetical protein
VATVAAPQFSALLETALPACYSVSAEWGNKVVSVRLTAARVSMVVEGKVIAEHPRCFGRDQLACDPWHLCPVGTICPY